MKANRLVWVLLFLMLGVGAAQTNSPFVVTDSEAIEALKAKADTGDANAQLLLGWLYANGQGVSQDYVEAVRWYRNAADHGLASAQNNLGVCYEYGTGVQKDVIEAIKWYRRAADQGNAQAQNNLGFCYDIGKGISTNADEAVKWYRKSVDQGFSAAQFNLGLCYLNGKGVTANAIEAERLLLKAADQGDALAQNNLGFGFITGNGVTKDYVQAYKWLNLASAQGVEFAKKNLYILEQSMTPEQIAEGQQLSRQFRPRKESVSIPGDTPIASGTGFFITEDSFLVTCAHVVKGATQIRLVTSAGFISAKVVKVDSANDLALLKAEGKFSPLPIAASRAVRLGNTMATVGFPNIGLQGFAPKLAKGEIASLSGASDDARYFQISVPLQPGNSGGALVDERGNVVGIVSAKLNASVALAASGALPENVNYAVKSSFLLSFLESVPEVSARLKEPNAGERKFEDVVKSAEQAAVLVLVY